MLSTDEDALICDLAETYHVFDYKSLPARTVATLAAGLSDDSRIKRRLSGMKVSTETLLLATVTDHLAFLAWTKTKDAEKGRNRPKSVVNMLLGETDSNEYAVFDSVESFEARRAQILGKE